MPLIETHCEASRLPAAKLPVSLPGGGLPSQMKAAKDGQDKHLIGKREMQQHLSGTHFKVHSSSLDITILTF